METITPIEISNLLETVNRSYPGFTLRNYELRWNDSLILKVGGYEDLDLVKIYLSGISLGIDINNISETLRLQPSPN